MFGWGKKKEHLGPEDIKIKREAHEELFRHFLLCRAISAEGQECLRTQGESSPECKRVESSEMVCWGKLLCPKVMETYLECMKTKNGLSECMGEAQELGKCMESAKKRASKNRERVSAEELKVQKQCNFDRKALQECLEEQGGVDSEGKCAQQQRQHGLCVASVVCPKVRDRLGVCMSKRNMNLLDDSHKETVCVDEELQFEDCLTDTAMKQWEKFGIPTEEYVTVHKFDANSVKRRKQQEEQEQEKVKQELQ